MRLLELLGNCVRGPAGVLLTDAHVWEAAQCCFRIARMERCSHLLQRTSQSALTQAVLHVFSRIHEILSEAPQGEAATAAPPASASGTPSHPSSGTPAHSSSGSVAGHLRRHVPYGVPVLSRLMAWLAGLIEPRAQPRPTRVMALEILNIVLETGGELLGRLPLVVGVCQGDLCRNLIQVCPWEGCADGTTSLPTPAFARADLAHVGPPRACAGPAARVQPLLAPQGESAVLLHSRMSLLTHYRHLGPAADATQAHLKVQLEVFFTSVHLFLAESRCVHVKPAHSHTG